MKIRAYRIRVGALKHFTVIAKSSRKAVEATLTDADEVAIIWDADFAYLYRVEGVGIRATARYIGTIEIVEEGEE